MALGGCNGGVAVCGAWRFGGALVHWLGSPVGEGGGEMDRITGAGEDAIVLLIDYIG